MTMKKMAIEKKDLSMNMVIFSMVMGSFWSFLGGRKVLES